MQRGGSETGDRWRRREGGGGGRREEELVVPARHADGEARESVRQHVERGWERRRKEIRSKDEADIVCSVEILRSQLREAKAKDGVERGRRSIRSRLRSGDRLRLQSVFQARHAGSVVSLRERTQSGVGSYFFWSSGDGWGG